MSSAVDYVGRRVDVAAFQVVFPAHGDQLLAQELVRPGDGGAVVAGLQKLAQRVLLALCTVKGSKPYAADEGTQLLADAAAGQWRTVADVEQSFASAKLDMRRWLARVEQADDPADERLGTLTLVGVILAGDKVALRLSLTSQAGDRAVYIAPLTVALSKV